MKTYIIKLTVILLLSASVFQLKATHFAGSDLTYTCLGGTTYEIKLAFYRDCTGIPEPITVSLNIECTSNPSFNFIATLNKVANTCNFITQTCPYMVPNCLPSSNPNPNLFHGTQECVYTAIVNLPPCNSWNLSFSGCCRNPITTVPNNSNNNWYIDATLNNQTITCNSSPQFTNKPIAILCLGQTFCFNHGAVDPDGDSLSYSFYSPQTAKNVGVLYGGGYSNTNFLNSSTPITLDPITGDLCMTPSNVLSTIVGIRVEEWRTINGVPTLLGVVNRDMQLQVGTCNNQLPTLSGMDTTLSATYNPNDTIYWKEMCLGPGVQFHINGYDPDTANAIYNGNAENFSISWNNGIPGGTFQTFANGTDSAYALFSWLPTSADVSNTPKCFTATVQDDACPYNGMQTFSYCITVRGMLVDIGTDTLLCKGEDVIYRASADSSTQNYYWRIDGQSTSSISGIDSAVYIHTNNLSVGTHWLSIETDDGAVTMQCPGRDKVRIEVVEQPDLNISDYAFCEGANGSLDAGAGQLFTWKDPIGTTVSTNNVFNLPAIPSSFYTVSVDGGMNTRCTDMDTVYVALINQPLLVNDTCVWLQELNGSGYEIDALHGGNAFSNNVTYKWNTGATTQKISVNKSGNYSVITSYSSPLFTSPVQCFDTALINIVDKDALVSSVVLQAGDNEEIAYSQAYLTGDSVSRTICTHQKLKLEALPAPAGINYNVSWIQDGILVSSNQSMIFKSTEAEDYTFRVNVGGCEESFDIHTKFCQVLPYNVITPNGDGYNDVFVFEGLENYPNSKIFIYNRNGKKVYSNDDYKNDWDGGNLSDGVYHWVIEIQDGSYSNTMEGTLTLYRQ